MPDPVEASLEIDGVRVCIKFLRNADNGAAVMAIRVDSPDTTVTAQLVGAGAAADAAGMNPNGNSNPGMKKGGALPDGTYAEAIFTIIPNE